MLWFIMIIRDHSSFLIRSSLHANALPVSEPRSAHGHRVPYSTESTMLSCDLRAWTKANQDLLSLASQLSWLP